MFYDMSTQKSNKTKDTTTYSSLQVQQTVFPSSLKASMKLKKKN